MWWQARHTVARQDQGEVAERLRAALNERGVSIRQLAIRLAGSKASQKKLDNTRGQIYRWLKGASPSAGNAERLAAALEYPPDYFKSARRGAERAEAGDRQLADLTAALAELKATVDDLKTQFHRQRTEANRRLVVLERQLQLGDVGTPRGAARR